MKRYRALPLILLLAATSLSFGCSGSANLEDVTQALEQFEPQIKQGAALAIRTGLLLAESQEQQTEIASHIMNASESVMAFIDEGNVNLKLTRTLVLEEIGDNPSALAAAEAVIGAVELTLSIISLNNPEVRQHELARLVRSAAEAVFDEAKGFVE